MRLRRSPIWRALHSFYARCQCAFGPNSQSKILASKILPSHEGSSKRLAPKRNIPRTSRPADLLANFIAMSIGLEIRMKPPYQNAIWFGTAGLRLLLRAAHPSCGKRDRVKVGRACANLAFSKAKRDRLSIPPSGFSPIWPRKSFRLVVLRRRGNIPHRQPFSNTDDRFPQRIKGRASIDSFKNGVLLCSTVRIPRAL